jgi:hypothetical protein
MWQRGFLLLEVVVAHNEADALAKLLERRPNLAGTQLPPGAM